MTPSRKPEPSNTVSESVVETSEGRVTVRDYVPEALNAKTAFLWVHGGGFTSGGLDQHESDAPARVLAAAGIRVRTVDYRLAPTANPFRDPDLTPHPGRYPAGLNDVVAVAKEWSEVTGGMVNIGGASAGADLAAGAVLRLRDERAEILRSVFLAYGTLHAVLPPNEKIERELRGPLAKWAFNPAMLRRMNLNYVGDAGLLVPGYAFPGGADLNDFPPTLVVDAQNDRLRKSGHAFADELRAAGTEVRERVVKANHGFLGSTRGGAFRVVTAELIDWLRRHDGPNAT